MRERESEREKEGREGGRTCSRAARDEVDTLACPPGHGRAYRQSFARVVCIHRTDWVISKRLWACGGGLHTYHGMPAAGRGARGLQKCLLAWSRQVAGRLLAG